MSINVVKYQEIIEELNKTNTTLIAVSKTKPNEDILTLYNLGHRDFGENYVQELVDKELSLPNDIRWHFIGHLQSNKVKYIAPFVYLIHGVDSLKLLQEINKQAAKNNRIINCLLQIYIAKEETKFGLDEAELNQIKDQISTLTHIQIRGMMGMASFSNNEAAVRAEFTYLNKLLNKHKDWISTNTGLDPILSMGMSGDYKIAIEEGSNMVRIGSLLFGERNYKK